MQSIDLNADFTENDSNTISSASPQFINEVAVLQQQVADLNKTIVHLENAVQLKEEQLENFRHDSERLSSELKKQQRCNRNLKQQLDDERFFYQKEKEHFCEEMQNQRNRCLNSASKAQQQQLREAKKARDKLMDENKILREELIEKSETTYNLCIKFLRMKHAKDTLRRKLDQLLSEHLQVMAEMMEKLDEAREELNIIVSEKFQEPLPIGKAKFLQLVQRNSRLVHENAMLKLQIQQLTQNVEKLKSETKKSRTINVDARTIAKLVSTHAGRRRNDGEARKTISTSPHSKKIEKAVSIRESTSTGTRPFVDHSGDAKVPLNIRMRNWNKSTIREEVEKSRPDQTLELRKERTWSAPEIVQTTTFRQDHGSGNGTEYTEISKRNVEVRDACTDTREELLGDPNLFVSQNGEYP